MQDELFFAKAHAAPLVASLQKEASIHEYYGRQMSLVIITFCFERQRKTWGPPNHDQ